MSTVRCSCWVLHTKALPYYECRTWVCQTGSCDELSDFCNRCTYYWLDDTNKKRKPHKVKLNAPGNKLLSLFSFEINVIQHDTHSISIHSLIVFAEYIDNLMNWVRKLLDDETIFPPSKGLSLFIVIFILTSNRSSIPKKFQDCCEDNLQAIV